MTVNQIEERDAFRNKFFADKNYTSSVNLHLGTMQSYPCRDRCYKAGQFDHFTLQSPERAVAGENFVIKVSVYDANNNLITNFSETSKELRLTSADRQLPSLLCSAHPRFPGYRQRPGQ